MRQRKPSVIPAKAGTNTPPPAPKRVPASAPRERSDRKRRLTFTETHELAALPDRIDALERERETIYASLSDPALLRDGAAVNAAKARLAAVEVETNQLIARWEELETVAADWIAAHPEYHADLADADAALAAVFDVEAGRTNPFLHLSMHLSISEQCSIDQPRGIRQAVELLAAKRNSLHAAHHEAMDCLGQMLWESQRAGRPPDGHSYVECVQGRAMR